MKKGYSMQIKGVKVLEVSFEDNESEENEDPEPDYDVDPRCRGFEK